ncbi:MAG TPA: hypothetical protein VEU29_06405 [Actinomycetota bacterium]|nr:hypothetical protein [Actinomycetota bacterium]
MRIKALVTATIVASLSAAVPVDAAKLPRRAMLPYHYTDENHHFNAPGTGGGVWNTEHAYAFQLRKGDKAVSVMVLDDNERPVSAAIVQIQWDEEYGNASVGHAVTHEEFCGRTDAPVPVVPDLQVEIFIQKGVCDDGTPSVPTEGDIVVDFHR